MYWKRLLAAPIRAMAVSTIKEQLFLAVSTGNTR
jgi:hypothetical protein